MIAGNIQWWKMPVFGRHLQYAAEFAYYIKRVLRPFADTGEKVEVCIDGACPIEFTVISSRSQMKDAMEPYIILTDFSLTLHYKKPYAHKKRIAEHEIFFNAWGAAVNNYVPSYGRSYLNSYDGFEEFRLFYQYVAGVEYHRDDYMPFPYPQWETEIKIDIKAPWEDKS